MAETVLSAVRIITLYIFFALFWQANGASQNPKESHNVLCTLKCFRFCCITLELTKESLKTHLFQKAIII